MKGKMAEFKLNMYLQSETNISQIIKRTIAGETKGVNMAEKVLRGNLDDKSRNIAGQILEKDRNSIGKLNELSKKYD